MARRAKPRSNPRQRGLKHHPRVVHYRKTRFNPKANVIAEAIGAMLNPRRKGTNIPHDAVIRALLERYAMAFIKAYMPELAQLAAEVTLLPRDLLDKGSLRGLQADCVLKVRLKTGGYVLVVIEHRSTRSKSRGLARLKMLQYTYATVLREVQDDPHELEELKAVIPVLLYHGKAKWNMPATFGFTLGKGTVSHQPEAAPGRGAASHQPGAALGKGAVSHQPEAALGKAAASHPSGAVLGEGMTALQLGLPQEMLVINLTETPKEQLPEHPVLRATFQLMLYATGVLTADADAIEALSMVDYEASIRHTLETYLLATTSGKDKARVQHMTDLINQAKSTDGGSNMMTAIDVIEARGKAQGLAQGLERGLEQGMERGQLTGKAAIVAKLLKLKFRHLPRAVQQRLRKASSEELDLWAERILTAETREEVFGGD